MVYEFLRAFFIKEDYNTGLVSLRGVPTEDIYSVKSRIDADAKNMKKSRREIIRGSDAERRFLNHPHRSNLSEIMRVAKRGNIPDIPSSNKRRNHPYNN